MQLYPLVERKKTTPIELFMLCFATQGEIMFALNVSQLKL